MGSAGRLPAGEGLPHRDPRFTLTDVVVDLGPESANDARACEFGIQDLAGTVRETIERGIHDQVPSQFDSALQAAMVVRERTADGLMLGRSLCDQELTQEARDQRCAEMILGEGADPQAIRAHCEVRTGGACFATEECGRLRQCSGIDAGVCRNTQTRCLVDEDCRRAFPNDVFRHACTGATPGRCTDSERLCYWNLEVDRLEMLLSGLEIVLASSEDDITVPALEGWLGAPLLGSADICRLEEPAPFDIAGSAITGELGPQPGIVPPPED